MSVTAVGAVLPASPEQAALRAALVRAGFLVESGVAGVVGMAGELLEVVDAVDALVGRAAAGESAVHMRFPAVMPRRFMEAGGYVGSFPHLAGTVWAFEGTETQARQQGEAAAAGQDWSAHQRMSDVVLTPAACHPVYPALANRGPVSRAGLTVDTGRSAVYRHEPSLDPCRLQAFTMHELVRVGSPEDVLAWRDQWRDKAHALLIGLGLTVRVDEAADPFFGRAGRVLAASQREQALKFELLVPVAAPGDTAVASFNAHREHFSEVHALRLDDGRLAHTACLGFGIERLGIALLACHGLDPSAWPAAVRAALWP